MNWYPLDRSELKAMISSFMVDAKGNIRGVIVPHAGYEFSGSVAGAAYSYAKGFKKAVIFGPSHYEHFNGLKVLKEAPTPLGNLKIIKNDYEKIIFEHSVQNQLPFLKHLGVLEVLPLVVGELSSEEAKKIAETYKNFDGLFVFSTDLSHFLEYNNAKKIDKESVNNILSLKSGSVDACGINALKIFFELAKIRGFKPKLICYINSGDVIPDKSSVVGYASFIF